MYAQHFTFYFYFCPYSSQCKERHTIKGIGLSSQPLTCSQISMCRNKVKLQTYQWEYAQQKQVLGQRKVGKAECMSRLTSFGLTDQQGDEFRSIGTLTIRL
jgi:hypothetical protein